MEEYYCVIALEDKELCFQSYRQGKNIFSRGGNEIASIFKIILSFVCMSLLPW